MELELTLIIGIVFIGFLLLLVELFVIPGISIAGLGALGCFGAGMYVAYQNYGLNEAVYVFLISAGLCILFLFIALKTRVLSKFSMKYRVSGKDGYKAGSDDLGELEGQSGISVTPLRPAGAAIFGNKKVDVVTEGEFIGKNARIKVIVIDGNRVVVKEQ